jgi:hypothetical protein
VNEFDKDNAIELAGGCGVLVFAVVLNLALLAAATWVVVSVVKAVL